MNLKDILRVFNSNKIFVGILIVENRCHDYKPYGRFSIQKNSDMPSTVRKPYLGHLWIINHCTVLRWIGYLWMGVDEKRIKPLTSIHGHKTCCRNIFDRLSMNRRPSTALAWIKTFNRPLLCRRFLTDLHSVDEKKNKIK